MKPIDYANVTDLQYEIISDIRLSKHNLVWQTPILSLTGQAFLFGVAFGGKTMEIRLAASSLIVVTALASVQLIQKHRHLEIYYGRLLERIEEARQMEIIHRRPPKGTGLARWSSYEIWVGVLMVFGAAALVAAALAVLE